jgi:hypothetical protein
MDILQELNEWFENEKRNDRMKLADEEIEDLDKSYIDAVETRVTLSELIEIKKELQNIRILLEFFFAPKGEVEHVDGKTIRTRRIPGALIRRSS